jgi:hypothetical protein
MIKRAKGLENYFYNQFEHIWFKNVFDPKNYGFWKCGNNKNYSYLCDKGHEHIIYMVRNWFVVNMYLHLTWNVKLDIQKNKL